MTVCKKLRSLTWTEHCATCALSGTMSNTNRITATFISSNGESINCPAYPEVKETFFVKLQQQGLAMLVVTARTSDYSMLTNLWLREQGLHCDEMYMRERRDQRPDAEVKADLLAEIQRSYQPVLAVDDREHVAAVWRAAGIPVIMVAEDGSLHPDA